MITAWRIVPQQRANTAFDGEGARLFGGRWNSPGLPTVYLANSRALAALETLVHFETTSTALRFALFEVSIPENLVRDVPILPSAAQLNSATISPNTQKTGDHWLGGLNSTALRIYSSIIPEEANYLLNPRHPDFSQITIGPARAFAFDPLLIERK